MLSSHQPETHLRARYQYDGAKKQVQRVDGIVHITAEWGGRARVHTQVFSLKLLYTELLKAVYARALTPVMKSSILYGGRPHVELDPWFAWDDRIFQDWDFH